MWIKYSIKTLQDLAKQRNGICLSTEYKSTKKHKWKCKNNHIFYKSFESIKSGSWCPYCSNKHYKEQICRIMFEKLFNRLFIKSRLKILQGLELDGYCEKLNIAFEYNGYQHYENGHFKSHIDNELMNIKKRDKLKIRLCKKNNIKLIIIPYWINLEKLKEYIIQKCKEQDIIVPFKDKNIDYKKFDIYSETYINKIQNIIRQEKAIIVTKKYLKGYNKIKIKCKNNHLVIRKLSDISKDKKLRCIKCKQLEMMYTINDIKNIAIKNNGILLSNKYLGSHGRLTWQCNKGHIWKTPPCRILQGGWCPKCAILKQRKTLEYIQQIAKQRNGKCLSLEYINAHKKLEWQCNKGHIWKAPYTRIKHSNCWCPKCAKIKQKNRYKNKGEIINDRIKTY